ncbi:hypothetical protein F5877DRAFT_73428 [Lentinula edodes]|nr:hypothetical protein F5877DRAFT_73428 [Lentinula edodes]
MHSSIKVHSSHANGTGSLQLFARNASRHSTRSIFLTSVRPDFTERKGFRTRLDTFRGRKMGGFETARRTGTKLNHKPQMVDNLCWFRNITPGVNVDFIPQDNLTICSVAIRKCDDSFARTTLYLARGSEHEDSVALGTLSAQMVDQLSVKVKLAKSIQYSLHVEGPNPISVIGYYIGTGDGIVKRRHRKDSKRPRSDDSNHGRGSKCAKVEDGTKLKVKSHSSKHSEGKNRDPREGPGLREVQHMYPSSEDD